MEPMHHHLHAGGPEATARSSRSYADRIEDIYAKASQRIKSLHAAECVGEQQVADKALEAIETWKRHVFAPDFKVQLATADRDDLERQLLQLEMNAHELKPGESLHLPMVHTVVNHYSECYATVDWFYKRVKLPLAILQLRIDETLDIAKRLAHKTEYDARLAATRWREKMLKRANEYGSLLPGRRKTVDTNLRRFERSMETINTFRSFRWTAADLFTYNFAEPPTQTLPHPEGSAQSPSLQYDSAWAPAHDYGEGSATAQLEHLFQPVASPYTTTSEPFHTASAYEVHSGQHYPPVQPVFQPGYGQPSHQQTHDSAHMQNPFGEHAGWTDYDYK
ncbi:hypothetical protein JCM10908_006620 [Rhodotorula pacifica]|uniref:uncharacterized protein n=1 Tax=Rhodotorula pacifica TaxID=1495444 RepID=UPI00317FF0BD